MYEHDTKFPQVAVVHERTVQEAQQHADANSRPARHGDPRRPRAGRVLVAKADTEVMTEALRLAGGDARRLKVNWDGSVYVR